MTSRKTLAKPLANDSNAMQWLLNLQSVKPSATRSTLPKHKETWKCMHHKWIWIHMLPNNSTNAPRDHVQRMCFPFKIQDTAPFQFHATCVAPIKTWLSQLVDSSSCSASFNDPNLARPILGTVLANLCVVPNIQNLQNKLYQHRPQIAWKVISEFLQFVSSRFTR